ncbi:MAG: hypothetical protein L3V56_04960 [Candidatus Magnetoovum sp. WYHC-5]|nr:hypothetical protein [Candidatus Magnetoovum sp. WYHC-5]
MFDQIKDDFKKGIDTIKGYSGAVSARITVELSLVKLTNEIKTLENAKNEFFKGIGERVYEIRNKPNPNVFNIEEVNDLFKEIEKVDLKINNVKKEIRKLKYIEED